jgi:hypothetical protein
MIRVLAVRSDVSPDSTEVLSFWSPCDSCSGRDSRKRETAGLRVRLIFSLYDLAAVFLNVKGLGVKSAAFMGFLFFQGVAACRKGRSRS